MAAYAHMKFFNKRYFFTHVSSCYVLIYTAYASSNNCFAGGAGANSCAISTDVAIVETGGGISCEVGCNPGYYACCTLKGCHCVKEQPS